MLPSLILFSPFSKVDSKFDHLFRVVLDQAPDLLEFVKRNEELDQARSGQPALTHHTHNFPWLSPNYEASLTASAPR